MKRIVVGLLVLCGLLWMPSAWALTQAQLDQAIEHLRIVIVDANTMRDQLVRAEEGKTGTLTLTAAQKQQVRDEYAAAKAQIVTLMGQLP